VQDRDDRRNDDDDAQDQQEAPPEQDDTGDEDIVWGLREGDRGEEKRGE
jgi:hypothetical protein